LAAAGGPPALLAAAVTTDEVEGHPRCGRAGPAGWALDGAASGGYPGGRGLKEGRNVTKAEWLACEDPLQMLRSLRGRGSDRKLRLFACACCRLVQGMLTEHHLRAVAVAEQFADGAGSGYELRQARKAARFAEGATISAPREAAGQAADFTCVEDAWNAAYGALHHAGKAQAGGESWPHSPPAGAARLARDLFAPPRQRARVRPEWLVWADGLPVKLAEGAYADRAFDRLPVLADALEEAGCADPELLGHLRSPGPHVRGCWALDLILGKQ
jgi:hypothetical protein